MALEEQLLTAVIEETLQTAERDKNRLARLNRSFDPESEDRGEQADEREQVEERLKLAIEKLFRDLGILAERLGLPRLCEDIDRSRQSVKPTDRIDVRNESSYSPALAEASKYFESLEAMTRGRKITGLGVFETILKNTAEIVRLRNIHPSKEVEVRAAVFEVLGF